MKVFNQIHRILKYIFSFIVFLFTLMIISLSFTCKEHSDETQSHSGNDTNDSLNQFSLNLNNIQKEMFDEFITRLQKYPNFDFTEINKNSPKWEYTIGENPELKELSKSYDLQKIAGDGTEIDRFINLMDWVYQITSSDGELGNPEILNTISILNFIQSNNRSVNCRMKSIILNEILLSFGYYSRRISFKPSQYDGDSHSIVMVFSNMLDKWICLDPTFNTYFHDTSGNILGYLEIREAYKAGQIPLFRSIQTPLKAELRLRGMIFHSYDAWYSVYMAKNCFMVSCPQRSEYGYESSDSLLWILLLPSGYQSETIDQQNVHKTSNHKFFFQKPVS